MSLIIMISTDITYFMVVRGRALVMRGRAPSSHTDILRGRARSFVVVRWSCVIVRGRAPSSQTPTTSCYNSPNIQI